MPPTQNSSGVLNSIVPRHSVAIQLRIFTPVGTAIRSELSITKHEDRLGDRRREHVVGPGEEAEERDRHGRGRDRLVAEDRLAREHGQDLGDDPEAGQHHDVDLGVPEEPEQVLPQQRRAALGGVEEVGAEVAVGQQHRHRRRDHRQREDQQDRVGEDRPHEQRQAPPAHAAGAHVGDRRVEVDRPEERGEAGEVDQVDPRVLAAAGRVDRARRAARRSSSRLPAGSRRSRRRRRSRPPAAASRRARSGAGRPCRGRRSSAARSSWRGPPSSARRTGRPSSSRAS